MSYLDDIYSQTENTGEDNLMWCFAVAHVIYHKTAEQDILDRMEWRHANVSFCSVLYCAGLECPNGECSHEWPESEILWALRSSTVTEEDLIAFAEMVEAKDREFRAAGWEL